MIARYTLDRRVHCTVEQQETPMKAPGKPVAKPSVGNGCNTQPLKSAPEAPCLCEGGICQGHAISRGLTAPADNIDGAAHEQTKPHLDNDFWRVMVTVNGLVHVKISTIEEPTAARITNMDNQTHGEKAEQCRPANPFQGSSQAASQQRTGLK